MRSASIVVSYFDYLEVWTSHWLDSSIPLRSMIQKVFLENG